MAITVNKIQDYMKNDFNILISGEAGTGKTYMIKKASENLGLKMKYYSASTLDPYADLIGIPVPQNDTKNVDFYRPREIDEAEVVFFDELNRADSKTLNTVFELIQFRSINGEKLPKLRSVMAAINPNDGNYTVDELDMALLDRFDVYLESTPTIDLPYFKNLFGADVAKAVHKFWNDYERNRKMASRGSKNVVGYISPRRMEKIVATFMKLPNRSTISETLPPSVNISANELYSVLNEARGGTVKVNSARKVRVPRASNKDIQDLMAKGGNIRHKPNRTRLIRVLESDDIADVDKQRLVSYVATHLSSNIGPTVLVREWSEVLKRMTSSDLKVMTASWYGQKSATFTREARNIGINVKI